MLHELHGDLMHLLSPNSTHPSPATHRLVAEDDAALAVAARGAQLLLQPPQLPVAEPAAEHHEPPRGARQAVRRILLLRLQRSQ